jgi:hypothetical protein
VEVTVGTVVQPKRSWLHRVEPDSATAALGPERSDVVVEDESASTPCRRPSRLRGRPRCHVAIEASRAQPVRRLCRVETAGPPVEPREMLSGRRLADAELVGRGRHRARADVGPQDLELALPPTTRGRHRGARSARWPGPAARVGRRVRGRRTGWRSTRGTSGPRACPRPRRARSAGAASSAGPVGGCGAVDLGPACARRGRQGRVRAHARAARAPNAERLAQSIDARLIERLAV